MPFLRKLIISSQFTRELSYGKLKTWYSGLVKRPPPIPPYSHVIQIGDPVLRMPSEPVPVDLISSPEVKLLIAQMKTVFSRYDCVGLSAPQVGISLRVLIIEISKKHVKTYTADELKRKDIQYLPQTVIINPEMKVLDYNKVVFSEACESIKGFSADVPRYHAVEIKGRDEENKEVVIEAKGWLARILQHEMDHLNGKLYTDIMDRKTLACSCWQVVNERRGKIELPYHE